MLKDIQTNASALNEVISSTKTFLEENRGKLTPEQIAAVEMKLEESTSKANMLNQKAEETRKDLEKVATSAIKKETEKVILFLTLIIFLVYSCSLNLQFYNDSETIWLFVLPLLLMFMLKENKVSKMIYT